MYVTRHHLCDPSARVSGPSITRVAARTSAAHGRALYLIGIFVETLGLGLIAAYGWFVAGVVLAGAGVWIATIGNRAWPAPDHSATPFGQVTRYLESRVRPRADDR